MKKVTGNEVKNFLKSVTNGKEKLSIRVKTKRKEGNNRGR